MQEVAQLSSLVQMKVKLVTYVVNCTRTKIICTCGQIEDEYHQMGFDMPESTESCMFHLN